MKTIFAINGSPRKNGNTAQLLQKALEGAASVGAEVKLIQLADLNFSGCRSCFACKKLANPSSSCILKDDLAEILKELLQADGIIMGSPIYFGAESGLYRNFLERLFFPMLRYTNPPSSRAEKRIDFGFIYTMNVPENVMDEYGYRTYLESINKFPQMIFGSENVYTLYACNTHQLTITANMSVPCLMPLIKPKCVRLNLFPTLPKPLKWAENLRNNHQQCRI